MKDFIVTTIYSICFGLGVIGCALFLWPVFLKRICNAGTMVGLAASFLCMGVAIWHKSWFHIWEKMWQNHFGIAVFLLIVAAIGIVWVTNAVVSIVKADSEEIPKDTPAVVLGCSVIGRKPSRILLERLDAAETYLNQNSGAVAVLSGGQGADEEISEAECMYEYLTTHGIEADRLYMEDESDNTQQNLSNSIQMLQNLNAGQQITIITSEFHLYRGRKWAEQNGITSYGYAAKTHWSYLPTFFAREVLAVMYLKLRMILWSVTKS